MTSEHQSRLFPPEGALDSVECTGSVVPDRVGRTVEEFRGMVTALAPWFGSNRMLGPQVGRHLQGCEWVGIPFGGGMAEVPHIKARTVVINDIHTAIITLARVTSDHVLGPLLYRRLRRKLLHPTELTDAQDRCRFIEIVRDETSDQVSDALMLQWAEHYFTAVWMARADVPGNFRRRAAAS